MKTLCVYYHPESNELFIGSKYGSTVWMYYEHCGWDVIATFFKDESLVYIGEFY